MRIWSGSYLGLGEKPRSDSNSEPRNSWVVWTLMVAGGLQDLSSFMSFGDQTWPAICESFGRRSEETAAAGPAKGPKRTRQMWVYAEITVISWVHDQLGMICGIICGREPPKMATGTCVKVVTNTAKGLPMSSGFSDTHTLASIRNLTSVLALASVAGTAIKLPVLLAHCLPSWNPTAMTLLLLIFLGLSLADQSDEAGGHWQLRCWDSNWCGRVMSIPT